MKSAFWCRKSTSQEGVTDDRCTWQMADVFAPYHDQEALREELVAELAMLVEPDGHTI
jgi:hypothetical protein